MAIKKVYIEYEFKDGPYGGANQFLKNLKQYFVENDCYTETPDKADFILINHTYVSKNTLNLKRKYPDKIFIHRMDGPVSKHRKYGLKIDRQSFLFDRLFCNGTVFQSKWTEENCLKLGYKKTQLTTVICNAPNNSIFFKKGESNNEKSKIKLISTGWSQNWNKGYDIMQFLDQNLDFSKYEYTFIGRTPVVFKNIKVLRPLISQELAKQLQEHDIYLALSKNESCSNSLLEAINCGLPVVARNSGCYSEIIKEGGVIFLNTEECIDKINNLVDNIEHYKKNLPYYDMEEIGKKYFDFMLTVDQSLSDKTKKIKKNTILKTLRWNIECLKIKFYIKVTDKISTYHK